MTQDNAMDVSPSWQELKEERDRLLEKLTRADDRSSRQRRIEAQLQGEVNDLEASNHTLATLNAKLIEAGNALRDELVFWQGSELAVRTQEARDRWTFAAEEATCDT